MCEPKSKGRADRPWRRVAKASFLALGLFGAFVLVLLLPYQQVFGQGAASGAITQTTTSDFSGACVVLPTSAAAPVLTNASVSSAAGGEVRLRATVEDYFDSSVINTTQWITGASNPTPYPKEAPVVASGVLSLYGSYLRSQIVFTETTTPRFFEASARFVGNQLPSPTNGDIGFYRAVPPPLVPGDQSSIRLFISQPFNSTNNRLMYVRSRDGSSAPVVDTLVDNWGDDESAQRAGLAQYRTYRIDWGATETWYLIDGSVIITAGVGQEANPLPFTGVTTRTTYVFLYNQDPQSQSPDPLLIDWVRAGQYAAQGLYTSCVHDAGQIANWSQATVTATTPVSTGIALATRTSADGVTWSAWVTATGAVGNGASALAPGSPSGRYLQYRLALASSDPLRSPEVTALTLAYFNPAAVVVSPALAALNPGVAQQFTASVRDVNNAVVAGVPVAWSVVNGGGVINASGRFTAALPSGLYSDTVRATASGVISGVATVRVRAFPVANAGGPYSGVEAQPVTLDASASSDPNGGGLVYSWDLDDDGQFDDASGVAPTASWPDQGVYTVRVLVAESGGLTNTASSSVTINNAAPQITAITNTGPVRRGQLVTVTVTATDVPADPLRYSFDWNSDGNVDINQQTANSAATTFSTTGAHTVTVSVHDGDGGVVTGTTTVTVTPQVLGVVATNSGPVVRAQPVTAVITGVQELNDTLFYSFDWNNDGLFEIGPQGVNTSTQTPMLSGVFTVGVRVTDADGGSATGATVVVALPQTLQIVERSNSTPALRGQPVTVAFTVTQQLSDPLTYSFDWDNDGVYDVVDQPTNSAITTYASTGPRVVGLRARDSSAGVVTGTTTVTVTPQVLTITGATNSGPVRRAQAATVTVTATQGLADTLLYAFDWNNDASFDTPATPANSAAFAFPSTGDKVVGVRVIDADGGSVTSTTTVQVTPQLLAISGIGNPSPVLRNEPVTVVVTATQELGDSLLYAFDWDGDGLFDTAESTTNSATTSYATIGPKTVGVRVRDSDGAVVTGTTTVTVSAQLIQILDVSSNAPQRRGQPVTLAVTAAQQLNEPLFYAFDWNNDGAYDVEQPGNVISTTYPATGAKTVRVRVRDGFGSEANTQTVLQITPQTLTLSAVTNSGPVRRGKPVVVTATAVQELSDLLIYAFDWNRDGAFEISGAVNSSSQTPALSGAFPVMVRVSDGDGAAITGTTTVSVTPQLLTVGQVTNSGPVRRGQSVTVVASVSQELNDTLAYAFDLNNDGVFETNAGATNSTVTSYTATGVKPVTMRVRDASEGQATGVTTITVQPQALQITALANSGPVAPNQPVTLSVTAAQELADPLRYSFDWENDGLYNIVDQPANFATTTYGALGNKTVRVRVRDADGGEVSATTTIVVEANAVQIISITSAGDLTVGAPVTISVEAVQAQGSIQGYAFDWTGDGSFDLEQASNTASHVYTDEGVYTVRVRVRGEQGREAIDEIVVVITTPDSGQWFYLPTIVR